MIGTGTLVNCAAIVLGGLIGMGGGKLLPDTVRSGLMTACAVCVLFIGIEGAVSACLVQTDGAFGTRGALMTVGSFAIGTAAGEFIGIEKWLERFGAFLKRKFGSEDDEGFVGAFVTASLTVCIGAMAVVGSINDGIAGDPTVLFVKASLDFLIILIMASGKGAGCLFAAIPVAVLQFSVTFLAHGISPYLSETMLGNLSLTGSMLIFCVGLNLLWDMRIRVANMLPVLIAAMFWPA
ncbi:MAG: DUF554 domain-containing protein [Mailhella sp.]|nr:DUF554 domain-containing protein [Mailhella sp.]